MKTGILLKYLSAAVIFMAINGVLFAEDFPLQKCPENGFTVRDGLPNVAQKLHEKKAVTVAYIGGSITAQDGWRVKTMAWLRTQFPDAEITEVNATIGGTGSDLGVYRFEQDVLAHSPDLIFVEFAVNDGGAEPARIIAAMEGMVRKTWMQDPKTDICFTYTFVTGYDHDYKAGNLPRSTSADEILAAHYGIPTVDMAELIARYEAEGKLVYAAKKGEEPADKIVFSEDGVHPHDAGHEVYMETVRPALIAMLGETDGKDFPHELKTPLSPDPWTNAKIVPITRAMLGGAWDEMPLDDGLGKWFGNRMRPIWHTGTPGATLAFKFRGTDVGVYDLLGPDGGQVSYEVDGTRSGPRAFFDSYCNYHRLGTLFFAQHLPADETHTVRVELDAVQPDRGSVTDREKDTPHFDPKRYAGTCLWFGGILMRGELVEE